jgi:uncharacterized repeat protein (TIGR03803 family)
LYGPCFSFGKNYNGAVSELSPGPTGWKEKNLYDFCTHPRGGICQGGNYPGFQLSRDAAGNLYGVTMEGGVHKAGVAFELEHTAEGWKEHVLHSVPVFAGDGYYFTAGVTLDPAGNVYGTTLQGGNDGTVYRLSRQPDGAWKETILWNFPNADLDGGAPAGGLLFDKAGNLFGTTTCGGDPKCSCGVVFELTPLANGKWIYQVLHRFIGADGWVPEASMIIDDQGNLYGTASGGGAYGYGVVFEITP